MSRRPVCGRRAERRGMSRRRRAILLLGLALLLGGLAASDVARREAAVRAQLGPVVAVVVARADLPAGRALDGADLGLRRVPARYAPVGAASVPETLIGQRLASAVPRGAYLGAAQIAIEPARDGPPVRKGERAAEVVGLGAPGLDRPGRARRRPRHPRGRRRRRRGRHGARARGRRGARRARGPGRRAPTTAPSGSRPRCASPSATRSTSRRRSPSPARCACCRARRATGGGQGRVAVGPELR